MARRALISRNASATRVGDTARAASCTRSCSGFAVAVAPSGAMKSMQFHTRPERPSTSLPTWVGATVGCAWG